MLGFRPPVEASLNLSLALETPVLPATLLAYASFALKSVQKGNYTEAERVLAYVGKLPPNLEHNLKTFITLVQELVALLDSLRSRLDEAKVLVDSGQVALARQKIADTERVLADASGRLDLLFSALDRVRAVYRIDTSRQQQDLEMLSGILREFERILAELKASLASIDARVATQLGLSVSPNPVRIEQTLRISGYLQGNGTWLPGRTVGFWISGIQAAKPVLDENGTFSWDYPVSSGKRADTLEVYASFTPTGGDVSTYRPTRSPTITVSILYHPVALTLVTSVYALHILENFTVSGTLADPFGRALAGETVELLTDGSAVSSSPTDIRGAYNIRASFPSGASEGTHQLRARFAPRHGIYASALSQEVGVRVYYLKPTISLYSRYNFTVSGQNLVLAGRLEIGQQPFADGLVITLLGDRELGRGLSGADGIFSIPINIPFEATGDTTLMVVYVPAHPWITSTAASLVLGVLNSGLVGFGSIAFAVGAVTLYGRASELGSTLRRRRREPEQVAVETPKPIEEAAPRTPATIRLAELKTLLDDARTCVKETYWEIRRLVAAVLHDKGQLSETHREFETRIVNRLGNGATVFSLLTGLFEVAEYSHHAPSRRDGEQAINCAILVAEAINVDVKLGPIRFCNRCGHKFEGTAVSTRICPRCGTKFEESER